MPKLIMTKGLPASGKTTWAKNYLATMPRVKRINKDDLRAMLDNGEWSKENENFVILARDYLIKATLASGYDCIVDDTNLAPKHEQRLREIALEHSLDFEIKDFTDVTLRECLKRDSERVNSVGEKVIRGMYNSFLKGKVDVAQYPIIPYNDDLPASIIVDIDGTLAHMNGRSPYDYSKVSTDTLDETVASIVRRYYQRDIMSDLPDTYVVIVSGREAVCKPETEQWLADNGIRYDELYMRAAEDKRDDRIVKQEIYEANIKPRFNVRFVLDDRDRVVKMWREQGLKVLQVAEGDF
ncbi:polynucleotide kinase [uncultured Caudovirales phage]|uniref:Polynucleotide kinase n=1 Tax=uncultured Caudovirales phage TaxID=2100421 RepID=A0A6J5QQ93_9CAUD|nr:polynucleotide kinase [uncultured Caudovirales phage]CAB4212920.1 polynucleotide kinase [uncultured Caudovirales phage]